MDTIKYKNRNRKSPRAQWWDYSDNAAYFVTICTANRVQFFGEIHDGVMHLSSLGILADVLWYEIINHAKNIELDAYVVMPNHIHGILIFNDDAENANTANTVGTRHALSLQSPLQSPLQSSLQSSLPLPGKTRFQNQGKNTLSSVIGSYKSAVTKHAHRLKFEFGWQDRFHDHIIRNEESFHLIEQYIENNAINWESDNFYPIENAQL